ncbi:uncharacterized protein [Diabrotica undecimpunctata]|uniref:uncharacterized protein n=1 Tax=Diabrotica undecimpunctata TaxID=50387 RepID=UPI003B632D30
MLAPIQSVDDPVDSFCLFLDEKIVNEIVKCTNKEAEKVLKIENWKYCDSTELSAFIRPLLTAGHLSVNIHNENVLWSKFYGPTIFKATMRLKHNKNFLRFVRFDDKDTRSEQIRNDELPAILDVWNQVNQNFQKYYLP